MKWRQPYGWNRKRYYRRYWKRNRVNIHKSLTSSPRTITIVEKDIDVAYFSWPLGLWKDILPHGLYIYKRDPAGCFTTFTTEHVSIMAKYGMGIWNKTVIYLKDFDYDIWYCYAKNASIKGCEDCIAKDGVCDDHLAEQEKYEKINSPMGRAILKTAEWKDITVMQDTPNKCVIKCGVSHDADTTIHSFKMLENINSMSVNNKSKRKFVFKPKCKKPIDTETLSAMKSNTFWQIVNKMEPNEYIKHKYITISANVDNLFTFEQNAKWGRLDMLSFRIMAYHVFTLSNIHDND